MINKENAARPKNKKIRAGVFFWRDILVRIFWPSAFCIRDKKNRIFYNKALLAQKLCVVKAFADGRENRKISLKITEKWCIL